MDPENGMAINQGKTKSNCLEKLNAQSWRKIKCIYHNYY
jgi:hypothetical protein